MRIFCQIVDKVRPVFRWALASRRVFSNRLPYQRGKPSLVPVAEKCPFIHRKIACVYPATGQANLHHANKASGLNTRWYCAGGKANICRQPCRERVYKHRQGLAGSAL